MNNRNNNTMLIQSIENCVLAHVDQYYKKITWEVAASNATSILRKPEKKKKVKLHLFYFDF